MRSRALVSLLIVTALGCKSSTEKPSAPPAAATPSPEDALLDRICATATCTGPMARLEIWRDASGAIGRVIHDGDIQRCSHPPRQYFDRAGKETLVIPFEPVEPGSAKALEYGRKQDEQRAGLTKDRELSCSAR